MKKFSLLIAVLAVAGAASAQVTGYSNLTNYTNAAYSNGGATTITGDDITTMVADDITFQPLAANGFVTGFSWTVNNGNTTAVTARSLVRFYAANGTSGGPGTFLGGLNFAPNTFAASTRYTFSYASPTTLFTVPSNAKIWAGLIFDDNNGATGATAAQLNLLGQNTFNPPTVGSSSDLFFKTSTAGSFVANNPTGSFLFFGGSPVANFGWSFTVNPTPEPSALLAVGLGAIAMLRRRKHA